MDVVLVRDTYDNPEFSSFIVVTKRDNGNYDLYRFFKVASPEIVVSADFQNIPADEIFVKLFDKYSDRKKV
jgi:5-formaminoimidazole-4-carboxamide-1-beta-D-ribofuranosyl 5'-monophosphate synthetase